MRTAAFVVAFALSSVCFAQDKPAAPSGPTATPIPDTPPPAAKPAPAVKPAPAAAAPAAAAPAAASAASAAKPATAKPMSAARKGRREEDARHCLEKSNNNEIIKCAEAYL
jgi:2-oxoglutarate decarboxylase